MLREKLKGFVTGVIATSVIITSMLSFAEVQSIQAFFNQIKIVVDGVEKTPPYDSKPFVYNDRIYVSLRFISEAFGKKISWNGEKGTVIIGIPPATSDSQGGIIVDNQKEKTNILFEFKYENFAWGHQKKEATIYDNGELWKDGSLVKSIDKKILDEKYSLVKNIDETTLSDKKNTACDAGENDYWCYKYVNGTKQKVLLLQSGDWTIKNTNPDANKLVLWIKEVIR